MSDQYTLTRKQQLAAQCRRGKGGVLALWSCSFIQSIRAELWDAFVIRYLRLCQTISHISSSLAPPMSKKIGKWHLVSCGLIFGLFLPSSEDHFGQHSGLYVWICVSTSTCVPRGWQTETEQSDDEFN